MKEEARRFTVAHAAWLLCQPEKWVRQKIGDVVPLRRDRRKGGQGSILYLTKADLIALAVATKYEDLPMARKLCQYIASLHSTELERAADAGENFHVSESGALPPGRHLPGERMQIASEHNGRKEPQLYIPVAGVWDWLCDALDRFDEAHGVEATMGAR